MCKFGLFAAAVVVGVGFGWIASTKARVAPPMMMSSHTIEPMKMMVGSANLHTGTSSIIRSFTRKYLSYTPASSWGMSRNCPSGIRPLYAGLFV